MLSASRPPVSGVCVFGGSMPYGSGSGRACARRRRTAVQWMRFASLCLTSLRKSPSRSLSKHGGRPLPKHCTWAMPTPNPHHSANSACHPADPHPGARSLRLPPRSRHPPSHARALPAAHSCLLIHNHTQPHATTRNHTQPHTTTHNPTHATTLFLAGTRPIRKRWQPRRGTAHSGAQGTARGTGQAAGQPRPLRPSLLGKQPLRPRPAPPLPLPLPQQRSGLRV